MRWQAAAFAAGDFAAAALAASGANPIIDPEAAMAAIPAALHAGRVFSTEALPLCAGLRRGPDRPRRRRGGHPGG